MKSVHINVWDKRAIGVAVFMLSLMLAVSIFWSVTAQDNDEVSTQYYGEAFVEGEESSAVSNIMEVLSSKLIAFEEFFGFY